MLEGQKGRDVGEEGVEVQMLPALPNPQNSHQHRSPQQSAQSGSPRGAAAPVLVGSQKDGRSGGTAGSQKSGWSCFHSSYWTWSGSFGTRKAVVGGVGEEGRSSWQKWMQNRKRRCSWTPGGGPSPARKEVPQKTQPVAAAVEADAGAVELAVDAAAVGLDQGL